MPIFRFTVLAITLGLLSTPYYSAIAATNSPAFNPDNLMQSEIYHFAQNNPLADFTAENGSKLLLSDKRSIMGDKSLLWKWQGGSSFILHKKILIPTDKEASKAWGRASTPVLSFWIYNEKPVKGYLTVDLGEKLNAINDAQGGFKVKLDFTGWRAIGISLNNDLENREMSLNAIQTSTDSGQDTIGRSLGTKVDSIRFKAPSNISQGEFYIDRIMFSVDDARYQWSDNQVKTRLSEPEILFHTVQPQLAVTPENLAAVNLIRQRLINEFVGGEKETNLALEENTLKLKSDFDALKIHRLADGSLQGRHLITDKQTIIYQPEHLNTQDKQLFDNYVILGNYTTLMFNISRAYVLEKDLAQKAQLKQMYLLMTEHLLDQGFVDGSALVTTHHWGYSSRWWYISTLLMSDALKEANLQTQVYDSLLWYSREFKNSFDMKVGADSSDLDYFNTLSRQHLALLLLEPDDHKRINLINTFSHYITGALTQVPPGGKDGLRPDGTAWRHEGNYPGYSFPAFKNASQLIYLLRGTPFAVGESGWNNLKKAMVSAWIYSNPEVGLPLAGRHPFNSPSLKSIAQGYYWLAMSSPSSPDKTLASIYLAINDKTQNESRAIFGENITPATLPQGFYAFNGGAFGIHRWQDKMVTFKAYNTNVWSSEIYHKDNRYGRYQSHGVAQIVRNGDQLSQGYQQEGWDWNRMPGATTLHLSLQELDSPKPHTLMQRGERGFSGTSALEGKYGMMAFDLLYPANLERFDPHFTAKKTVLAADNHLIFIGSDINSGDSNKNVETTLFQHAITPTLNTIWINGQKIETFPYQATLKQGDWIIDSNGNGYLITQAEKVNISRQHQTSAENKNRTPTQGNFSSAWIDHSTQPKNSSYEYMVFLDATPEKMTQLAQKFLDKEGLYQVIRKDKDVHIIYDKLSDVTGYAFYQPTVVEDKWIKKTDQPSIIMTQQKGNTLVVSAVTPDLNMTRQKAATPVTINVTINGKWQSIDKNSDVISKVSGDNTELIFTSYFGIPQEINLSPLP